MFMFVFSNSSSMICIAYSSNYGSKHCLQTMFKFILYQSLWYELKLCGVHKLHGKVEFSKERFLHFWDNNELGMGFNWSNTSNLKMCPIFVSLWSVKKKNQHEHNIVVINICFLSISNFCALYLLYFCTKINNLD